MGKTAVHDAICRAIGDSLSEYGIEYLMPVTRDTSYNKYISFKLSERRMICYVQLLNRTIPQDQFNFAVRLKPGDRIETWTPHLSDHQLFRRMSASYILPWNRERGYPPRTIDPAKATQQFAWTLTEEDVEEPTFRETVGLLVRAAHAAVIRNWHRYNDLTRPNKGQLSL